MALRLVHQPSDYHGDDRYAVYSGQWACGAVIRQPGEESYLWVIHAGGRAPPDVALSGHAADLEAAKAAFRSAWDRWLEYAGLEERVQPDCYNS